MKAVNLSFILLIFSCTGMKVINPSHQYLPHQADIYGWTEASATTTSTEKTVKNSSSITFRNISDPDMTVECTVVLTDNLKQSIEIFHRQSHGNAKMLIEDDYLYMYGESFFALISDGIFIKVSANGKYQPDSMDTFLSFFKSLHGFSIPAFVRIYNSDEPLEVVSADDNDLSTFSGFYSGYFRENDAKFKVLIADKETSESAVFFLSTLFAETNGFMTESFDLQQIAVKKRGDLYSVFAVCGKYILGVPEAESIAQGKLIIDKMRRKIE